MLAEQETVSPGARLPRVGGAGPGGSPPGHDPRLTPSRRPWAQHAGQPNDDIRTFQGSEQRAQMFQFVFAASEVWQARTARVRGATARLVDRLAARLSHSSLPHEPTADHWSAAGPRLFASGCPPPLREPMAAPAGYMYGTRGGRLGGLKLVGLVIPAASERGACVRPPPPLHWALELL